MKSFKSIATREEENHAHGKTPAVPRPGPSLLHDPSRPFDIGVQLSHWHFLPGHTTVVVDIQPDAAS